VVLSKQGATRRVVVFNKQGATRRAVEQARERQEE
jgi:hypothetical protein